MKRISTILCTVIALLTAFHLIQPRQSLAYFMDWEQYKKNVLFHQNTIPGWCCQEKAEHMMDLIYEVQPEICVEIGVFGGSSIYPTASALKFLKQGTIHAIDSWSSPDCVEGYASDDSNYQWWNKVDLEQVYLDFVNMLDHFRLSPYCAVMRMTGLKALDQFADESIDILHIDGNHTEDVALSDAQMYLPKVKKGGYIWFDDVNWLTTHRALEFLELHCTKDEMRSTNEYFLLRKNS
ncbi:class I SAM-dependent methyltransferase [Candidatus Rhabdochlamydia sp. T3358]|uniref:class I SAM-dependent methyltransferase n=1 Tax=Candidatus Rhabdochlamydia sp. T3358 TaxID=2099795 RepID=UPI0010BAABBE|nr:class I SAM-dependent methyltransferase [Candidatus Rhabdochlamydia sp. T3358]VHO04980.1 Cephalosporin hydroxylase [Candidatus Rhabdochlamydia sp. T3358]